MTLRLVLSVALLLAPGCAVLTPPKLAVEPPALEDMEEPLDLRAEPDDEAARRALDPGGFTGIYVSDARASLDAMLGDPEGLTVVRVVENSPAEAAGVEVGDLLLEANGESLGYPADWRRIELAAGAGSKLELFLDRAGAELLVQLVTVQRIHPAERAEAERFREEDRVGVVLRTATEVEARASGLAPGAGAVVVGLSASSPWRAAGLRFGDVITAVDGREVSHPQVLLTAIRDVERGDRLSLVFQRDGERRTATPAATRRAREFKEFYVPLLVHYENDGRRRDCSLLLGLYRHSSTAAGWQARLLWILRLGSGDADRLIDVAPDRSPTKSPKAQASE